MLSTDLSVQDPAASVKYYQERYGLTLVDVYHLPALGRSNYFLASLREGESRDLPEPGTGEVRCAAELQHAGMVERFVSEYGG